MRFRLNHSKKKVHTKLFINGEIVEDTSLLLDAWSQHYANVSKSKREELPLLQKLESHISNLDLQSYTVIMTPSLMCLSHLKRSRMC